MNTVSITIQKTTFDALSRLMRPALDDIDDVIVALLTSLERRKAAHATPADVPAEKAPPVETVMDMPASGHPGSSEHGLDPVEPIIPISSVPGCGADCGERDAHRPAHLSGSRTLTGPLGPNEVLYEDTIAVIGRRPFQPGMKVIVSPHTASEGLLMMTSPCSISFRKNGRQEWVSINAKEWKRAALKVAEELTNVKVVGEVVVFGTETEYPAHSNDGAIQDVGHTVNVTIIENEVIYEPEAPIINADGMRSFMCLRLILAILQNAPETQGSPVVIEFNWKDSDRAAFSNESGIFRMVPRGAII